MEILHILLLPIEKLLSLLFSLNFLVTHNYGFSIILLSVEISTLLIPLYRLAEKWKKLETDALNRMERDLKGIACCYQGAKKNYLIQKTYKLYNYHPIYSLRASLGLLIQIPFFFAAYLFLSHSSDLNGISFGLIEDLGKPDSLWSNINLLPFMMTGLNLLSGLFYSNRDEKMRYQLWIMALVFLVLLYSSPSGLVLYWTMNNLYSLIKYTIEGESSWKEKLFIYLRILTNKRIGKALSLYSLFSCFFAFPVIHFVDRQDWIDLLIIVSFIILPLHLLGLVYLTTVKRRKRDFLTLSFMFSFMLGLFIYISHLGWERFFIDITIHGRIILIELIALFVLLLYFHSDFLIKVFRVQGESRYSFLSWFYVLSLLFITFPLLSYQASMEEIKYTLYDVFHFNLLWFITLFLAISLVIILVHKFFKGFLALLSLSLLFFTLFNSYIYKINVGHFDKLIFSNERTLVQSIGIFFLDALILLFILFILIKILENPKRFYLFSFLILINVINFLQIAYSSLSIIIGEQEKKNVFMEKESEKNLVHYIPKNAKKVLTLSRNHKNIVVFFSDMLNGGVALKVLEDYPQYKGIFSGFVGYANSLSTSFYTQSSIAPMMGGQKYIADRLGEISGSISDKVIDAYDSMIGRFIKQGFEVGLFFPQIAEMEKSQYNNHPMLSYSYKEFAKYYRVEKTKIVDNIVNREVKKETSTDFSKELLLLSSFRIIPYSLKLWFYNKGNWHNLANSKSIKLDDVLDSWANLRGVIDFTTVKNTEKKQFKFLQTDLTHSPFIINKELKIDNTLKVLEHNTEEERVYFTALKTIKMVSEWIETLKREGIYDNTKIIFVSDHGSFSSPEDTPENLPFSERFFHRAHSTLWVKDFKQHGDFRVDNQLFLSNADVPAIAYSGTGDNKDFSPIDKDPIQNPIKERVLFSFDPYFLGTHIIKKKKDFYFNRYFRVKNSIFKAENWQEIEP